ncbi:AAA family ATPase [Paraburkholderia guartelaensis]|uniref:AAA family ATPase n=1 Tax=Paraburkholderia guartelaensis TaxID=2546446 RepID=UPI002AB64414|nr:AAA family ATPase [Paraburkholderia guartelaensis]
MAKLDYAAMVQQLDLTPQRVIDAIDDLNRWVCLHPKFVNLLQTILNAINGRSRDLLIVVIGPARVGKTTLFETLVGIVDELARQAGKKRGCFRFSVPSPDRQGRFNWRAAITEAYLSSGEILPFNKIVYGDITEGAPRRMSAVSGAKMEEALWDSFVKNARRERLVTFVDEGNTIPVTLSELQVTRAIHSLKDIVAQTHQPLLIFGTSNVRHIVEHDTQLKVRTKVLRLDAYGGAEEELQGFTTFIKEMEARLGPEFCEPGSLSSHAADIRRGVDGRPGLVVRLATDALSQQCGKHRLDWDLYSQYLNELAESSEKDLAEERHATNKRVTAAAEAPITKKTPKPGKDLPAARVEMNGPDTEATGVPNSKKASTSRRAERQGRVGATRNTNAPNHPFE